MHIFKMNFLSLHECFLRAEIGLLAYFWMFSYKTKVVVLMGLDPSVTENLFDLVKV